MSGGRAFVLDLNESQVNQEMVDIIAVPQDQRDILRNLLSAFEVDTGSVIAHELLADWDKALNRISLVMPRDYARALSAIEKANREGLPIDQYVMEVAAHG
jgi:glutamate synthase (NADPH/NADH) large chain